MSITKPFMGQGSVYLAPRDANGISGPYVHVGDCSKMELTFSQKFDDIHESMSGNRLVSAHIPTETTSNLMLEFISWDNDNLAKAINGVNSGSQVGATVTAEALSVYESTASITSSAFLKYQNVSAVVVHKGGSTAVAGTDYILDAAAGRLDFISTSTVITGASANAITVDYTYAAFAGTVQGLMSSAKSWAVRLDGINVADGGSKVAVLVPKCVLNLPKNLGFLADKHGTLQLDGMLLQDTSVAVGTSQFFTIQKQA